MENEKNTEVMSADPPHEIRWYERQFSLDDAKTFIKANITTAARSFIAIGFYLKCVRDRELFLEDGYQSVWEFAKAEYGISMSTASRYMTMNDRFSQDGNSPNVKEEYKAFGKSQLQEMLALTDEQLEQVKPTDRVEDIRGIRKTKEIPYIELPGQHEIEVDFPDIFPEEEFEIPPSSSVQKQEFSMDIAELAELVEDVPEGAAEAQQIEESIAISQQEPKKLSAYGTSIKVYPEDSLLTTPGCEGGHDCFLCHLQCDIRQEYCRCVEATTGNPFPCEQIDRIDTLREEIGERCQFIDLNLAYHRAGDHEPVPCCKECKEPCQNACERSIKKREAEEQAPDESWKFGSLPQAKEKYIKSLACILVEKKGKRLRYSILQGDLSDETVKWRLEDLADETDRAIEVGDDVIAYPCAEIIEFSRGDKDLGTCSYTRFGTQVRKAFEEWRERQDSAAAPVKPTEPDPVIDADYKEVQEDRPYTMDMVMTEIMRWKDRRESSKPGGTEPSEVMYKKACMMYDAMMALHASMGGEYDEIA